MRQLTLIECNVRNSRDCLSKKHNLAMEQRRVLHPLGMLPPRLIVSVIRCNILSNRLRIGCYSRFQPFRSSVSRILFKECQILVDFDFS